MVVTGFFAQCLHVYCIYSLLQEPSKSEYIVGVLLTWFHTFKSNRVKRRANETYIYIYRERENAARFHLDSAQH